MFFFYILYTNTYVCICLAFKTYVLRVTKYFLLVFSLLTNVTKKKEILRKTCLLLSPKT